MQIKLASIMVDDQEKALRFYTNVLGFAKKKIDITMATFRWLTVSSPEGAEGLNAVQGLPKDSFRRGRSGDCFLHE